MPLQAGMPVGLWRAATLITAPAAANARRGWRNIRRLGMRGRLRPFSVSQTATNDRRERTSAGGGEQAEETALLSPDWRCVVAASRRLAALTTARQRGDAARTMFAALDNTRDAQLLAGGCCDTARKIDAAAVCVLLALRMAPLALCASRILLRCCCTAPRTPARSRACSPATHAALAIDEREEGGYGRRWKVGVGRISGIIWHRVARHQAKSERRRAGDGHAAYGIVALAAVAAATSAAISVKRRRRAASPWRRNQRREVAGLNIKRAMVA